MTTDNKKTSKKNIPQKLSTRFKRHRRSITKYFIVFVCVAALAFVMYKIIPEGKETDCETQKFWATALKNIEGISIFAAAILYFIESRDRKQRKHYEAWQVIDAAHRVETSRARFQALQDLHEDGVVFSGLDLTRADLSCIILSGADLSNTVLWDANLKNANLSNADLRAANFVGADLTDANLENANLSNANLINADLSNTNLENANLSGANLNGADLSSARYLTPEQVKQARNWEKAKYSEEFRKQLGLPPD